MASPQVSAPVPPLDSGGSADESAGFGDENNKDPQNRPQILKDLPTLNGDIQPQTTVEHSNSPGDISQSKSADANGEGETSGPPQAEDQEPPNTSKDILSTMNSEWDDNQKTAGSFMHDSSDSDAENSTELIGGMIGLAKTDHHKAHSPLPKPQSDHDMRTSSSQLKKQVLSGEPGGRPSTPFPSEPGLLPPPLVDQLQGHTSEPVADGDGGVSRPAEGNADGESGEVRPRQGVHSTNSLSNSRANGLESSVVALPLPHVPQPPTKPGSPTHDVYHGGIRRHYNPPQSYSFHYQPPYPSPYPMPPEQYAHYYQQQYNSGRMPPGPHYPGPRPPYIYGGSIMERNADGPPPGHRGVPPPPPPPEENTGAVENHTRRFDPKTRRIALPARDVQPQRENGCHSVPGSPKSVAASVAPSTGLPTIVPDPQDMVRGRTQDEPPLPQQPYHRSLSPPQPETGRKTPRALSKPGRPNDHARVDQNIPFRGGQRIVAILPRNAPGYDPNRLQYGRGIIRRMEGNAVVVRLNPPHQGKYKLRPCDVFANDNEDVWSRADEFTEKQLRPSEIRKRSRGNAAALDGAPAPKRRRLSNDVPHRRPTPGCVGEIVHRENASHTRQNGHVPSQRSGEEKDMELGPNSRSTGLSQMSRQMNGTNTNSVHHHVHRARYTNPRSQNHQPTSHVAGRTQSRFHISNVHALSLPLNQRNGRVSNDGVTMMDIDETGDRHRPREEVFSEHHPAESVAGLSIGAPSVQSVAPVKGNGLRGLRQKWAEVSKFMAVEHQLTQQQLDYLVKENIDVETVESLIGVFDEKFKTQHEVMSFWLNYENANMFSVADILRINVAIRKANKQRQPRLF